MLDRVTPTLGLFGLKYFQVQSNTGSVMNLQRSAFPGKLSTPHVSAGGNALTPAIGQRIEGQTRGIRAGPAPAGQYDGLGIHSEPMSSRTSTQATPGWVRAFI